jgi:hypothetical protein
VRAFVELLHGLLQDIPPALGAIFLEALLDPLPGVLEAEALLELIGYLPFEFSGTE